MIGSNFVNVFFGLGVVWFIVVIVKVVKGEKFDVLVGNFGFFVVVFCVIVVVVIGVMMLRRSKVVGGELGGIKVYKFFISFFFCFFWVIYIVLFFL